MFDQQSDAPAMRASIDPDVRFEERTVGGEKAYIAHHRGRGKYFRLGLAEYHIAQLIDGSRSVAEICEIAKADGVVWTDEDIAKFIAHLIQNAIASWDTTPSQNGNANTDAEQKQPMRTSLLKGLSWVISPRIPLADGDRFARRGLPLLGWAFDRGGILVWSVLVASGLFIVTNRTSEFSQEVTRIFDPVMIPLLSLIWIVAKIFHELGHAVCAKHHGVRVGKTGIMFFLFAPIAYVDVTDAWKLQSRAKRIQIALAGVYVELAIASMAAWAWWLLPDGFARHLMAQIFMVAGPATLMVNANPLLRLDGYYVLSDLLEIPNLRMHGRRQLGSTLQHWIVSIPKKPSLLTGWRRPAATFHAVCSVLFQIVWMAGLVVAVSMWAKGAGIILGAAACLMWCLVPLGTWIYRVWMYAPAGSWGLNIHRRRLLGFASLVLLLAQHFAMHASPLARRVPVVVQNQDEQIARASSDAFVESVFVDCGDRVKKGMVLMLLKQPELTLKRDRMVDDLEIAKSRSIQFRRRSMLAEAAAEVENAESLTRQLSEIEQQIAGLKVVASRDGIVTTTNAIQLVGQYVNEGDELVRVSDPNEKELLVSVCEADLEAYRKAAGQLSSVRLRGGQVIKATPNAPRPRAQQFISHPALAASAGGPLAVEPDDESDKLRLVKPQLESVVSLDPITSQRLRAGQIGMMTIADNRSIFVRIYDEFMAETER